MAQPGVGPHLEGPLLQLPGQLQHAGVVGHGLVEVPLGVVGAAQVAVRPGLLPPVPQSLSPEGGVRQVLIHLIPGYNNARHHDDQSGLPFPVRSENT